MPPKIPFLKGTIKSQLPVETAYQPKQAGLCRAGPESAFSREEASSLTKGCCHTKTGRVSTVSKDNSGLVEIVRRHFHIHFIADADSDEILPHFSGDVSQHLMPVGQSNSKHGTWQNRCDRSLQCYGFFFRHKAFLLLYLTKRRTMTRASYTGTTIGNAAFDGRVRNGIGSCHRFMVTKNLSKNSCSLKTAHRKSNSSRIKVACSRRNKAIKPHDRLVPVR
jgi:hypothetical protein